MNIAEILLSANVDEVIKLIVDFNNYEYSPEMNYEYYVGKHPILDRADKPKMDEEGNVIAVTTTAKLVLNYPKRIVESAVAFLFGKPVTISKITEGGDEAFTYLKNALKNLYWDSANRQIARMLFIQQRAAKLFYIKNPQDAANTKIAALVLTSANGTFYPNFADNGDMDAFLRLFSVNRLIEGKSVAVDSYELYTAEQIRTGQKLNGVWVETNTPNPFGKIPVVFYQQSQAEWADALTLINRQELSISQLTDTNEYFSAPIAKVYGNVTGLADKESQGKAIQCEMSTDAMGNVQKADVDYLTWDQRPESLKLQLDLTEKYIYSFTSTPDISFQSMLENKPGSISGAALEFLMLDPVLKSYNKQEIFSENLSREISVVKSILGTLETKYANDFAEMEIEITFNSVLPSNLQEIISTLAIATGNKAIMSQETAVQKNPMIIDVSMEMERLTAEAGNEAGTFNF